MKVAFFQRLSQVCSLILYNAYLAGFVAGSVYQGTFKLIPCPGFNCH